MSIQTVVSTIETDLTNAFHTLEGDAETALTAIWNAAKPVFIAFEPTLVSAVLTALTAFLTTAKADVIAGDFGDIEQAFLEDLETTGSTLLGGAQSLGSNLLGVLIGLAKGIKV
jgi:hypothetical protein